jgi:uncharacterized protein (AIM24 family)
MEYTINGTVMQTVEVVLGKGEAMYTESGGKPEAAPCPTSS